MPRENTRSDSYEALLWDVATNAHRYIPKPGDRVLDLGAHFGVFALYCAARGCIVDAYEPGPEAFAELIHSSEVAKEIGLGCIHPHRAAVWSESGQRLMGFRKDSTAANSLLHRLDDSGFCVVKTVTLTEVLREETWGCVKADIEGAEAEVFRVAEQTDFDRIRFLTLEVHNDLLQRSVREELITKLIGAFPRHEIIPVKVNGAPTGDVATLLCWR